MTMSSLLPPNSTAFERAVEAATARIGASVPGEAGVWDRIMLIRRRRLGPVAAPIDQMLRPDQCSAAFLPWLAWTLSVDDWDQAWSETRKREVIAASITIHRHKGTVASIKWALAAAGYGDATVLEAARLPRLGRVEVLGRSWRLGLSGATWADYAVEITQSIFRRDADRLAARLAAVAPARCRLRRITLSGVRHVLGRGVWSLGNQTPLGGVFNYEVT